MIRVNNSNMLPKPLPPHAPSLLIAPILADVSRARARALPGSSDFESFPNALRGKSTNAIVTHANAGRRVRRQSDRNGDARGGVLSYYTCGKRIPRRSSHPFAVVVRRTKTSEGSLFPSSGDRRETRGLKRPPGPEVKRFSVYFRAIIRLRFSRTRHARRDNPIASRNMLLTNFTRA